MQKSKFATISVIIVIIIYIILKNTIFVQFSHLSTYIINPIGWIILSVILYKLFGRTYENQKFKKIAKQNTIIACLVYVIVYLISGLFLTLGENPYSNTIKGVLVNAWTIGVPIIFKEYIRYKLINNVYEKDKKVFTYIITIVFILIETAIWKLFQPSITEYYVFTYIFEQFLPIIAKNILYSYLAYNLNCTSAMLYEIFTNLYLWISPILPNAPWIVNSLIDISIPVILLLYVRYNKNKIDVFRTREKIMTTDPKHVIPLIVVIILSLWFALGIFPIKPVSIASGSMQDEINVGDVVIIKKCNANDVNVGDVIEYQMEGYTVVHRIIEKGFAKGSFYFITKGDYNQLPDASPVSEDQLIGKVIFKIKYIGYPAIWIDHMQRKDLQVEVET